jgi:hypothetical protein
MDSQDRHSESSLLPPPLTLCPQQAPAPAAAAASGARLSRRKLVGRRALVDGAHSLEALDGQHLRPGPVTARPVHRRLRRASESRRGLSVSGQRGLSEVDN